MRISDSIKKIQNLPEAERKIILWVIVVIIGIVLLFFYVKNFQQKIKSFNNNNVEKELGIPKLKEELNNLPKFEMPDIELTEEDKKELEELQEMIEQATTTGEATNTL